MNILRLHLEPFIYYGSLRGLREEEIFQNTSLYTESKRKENVVGLETFYTVLKNLSTKLTDDLLGIKIGEFCKLISLGMVHQISLQCNTIEEAIYYLKNFMGNTFPDVALKVTLKSNDAVLIELAIANNSNHFNRIILECYLVILSREITLMCSNTIKLQMTSPHCSKKHPISFIYGDSYTLSVTNIKMKEPLRNRSSEHFEYLLPQYLQLIAKIKKDNSLSDKVRMALLQMATPELPSMDAVAQIFGLSSRSLQRKLLKENTTFRNVVNHLKKDISILLLQHKSYLIKDIGYLLGYSESIAFSRAFKKWCGVTPKKYMQNASEV